MKVKKKEFFLRKCRRHKARAYTLYTLGKNEQFVVEISCKTAAELLIDSR